MNTQWNIGRWIRRGSRWLLNKAGPRGFMVLAVLLLLLAGCAEREESVKRDLEAFFTPDGIMRVCVPQGTDTVEVFSGNERVAWAYPRGGDETEIPFQWQTGAVYTVRTENGDEVRVQAPESIPLLAVRLHAPLGQTPHEFFIQDLETVPELHPYALPVQPGERLDLMLEIEKLRVSDPIEVNISTEKDPGAADEYSLVETWADNHAVLNLEFDKAIFTARVQAGESIPHDRLRLVAQVGNLRLPFELRFTPSQLNSEQIELVAWNMPTDAGGAYESGQPRDRLAMPNPVWDRIAVWFGLRPQTFNYLQPFAFQTLELRNQSPHPVTLLAVSDVLHPQTGGSVDYFEPPRWHSGGAIRRTAVFVEIGPGKTEPCVLPLHIKADTPAGTYLRKIKIYPLGSDRPLLELQSPLGVTRSQPFLTLWVLFSVVLTLLWLVLLLVFYRALVRWLGVRALVLLSLLGALQFCLQLLGGWVSSLFYALLGPFNCLVGGFLTELLTYLLVTSILCLLPRVGAMTLAGAVTYLMGAMMFGSVGLTDFLFVGSAIAFRELFLFVFGVTTIKKDIPQPPRLLPMMLALGIADAAATLTSLCAMAVFYRLFYADWYFVLNVGVTGFLYTCIGVWLGQRLGMSLRKVHA